MMVVGARRSPGLTPAPTPPPLYLRTRRPPSPPPLLHAHAPAATPASALACAHASQCHRPIYSPRCLAMTCAPILMKTKPNLPRGKDTFDRWRSRRWWSGFKSARFEPCNRYTTTPLVINETQLDWPCQEGFFYKWIEEHKQERVNTQSDNCKYEGSESQEGLKNSNSKD